jgi:hypothetical protein
MGNLSSKQGQSRHLFVRELRFIATLEDSTSPSLIFSIKPVAKFNGRVTWFVGTNDKKEVRDLYIFSTSSEPYSSILGCYQDLSGSLAPIPGPAILANH